MNIFYFSSNVIKLITLSLILSFTTVRAMAQIPFKEDFGGTAVDPAWLLPGTPALDAWNSQHPGLKLPYANLANGVVGTNGLNALDASGSACYAITKIKYNDEKEFPNGVNNGTNINSGTGDHVNGLFDHTTGDGSGYFAIINPQGLPLSAGVVIYEKTLSVSPGMEVLYFSAWATNIRPYGDRLTRLTFRITSETDTKSQDYDIPSGGVWSDECALQYIVPSGTNSITVSIIFNQPTASSSGDTHISGWEHSIALDDISVTEFVPSVTITKPVSGANYCQWHWMEFRADYEVLQSSSIYKWQYRATEEVAWSDIPMNDPPKAEPDQNSAGTLNTSKGTIAYNFSFNGAGYYRVLVADANDINYSSAIASQSIHLTMDTANSDDITFTHAGGRFMGDEVTLKASTNAAYLNTVFKWYSNDGTYLGEGAEYTTTLTVTTPTSGAGSFDYYVTLQHDGLCESPRKRVTVTAENNKMTEDFGGCDTDQPFIYASDNRYMVPGYSYLGVNSGTTTPNMGSTNFLITKQVYQNDFGSGITNWNTTLTDHTPGCGNGYFILFHTNQVSITGLAEFYKTTAEVCGGSKMSFMAWIANPGSTHSTVDLKFLVNFDNGESKEYTTGIIRGGTATPTWHQYGFDFLVPDDANEATFTIVQESGDGIWNWGNAFAMDDIEIKKLNPVQILAPENSEISVLTGQSVTLKGSYACGGLTGPLSYKWQKSVNGTTGWTDERSATSVPNGNFLTNDYTTDPVDADIYYRLTVSDGNTSISSEPIKMTPVSITSKTYFVCPDNMTDDEAASEFGRLKSGGEGIYLPGMKSRGEPGYLPSLIRMEVEEAYGIIYKWYEQESGGMALKDIDEYDPNQGSTAGVEDPVILSDGKTHTLSVQNERSVEGNFTNRTYWVEICDMDGNALDGVAKVPIHLVKGYLCGSLEPEISPANARRLSRADFGGTGENDDDILQNPLTGIDYDLSITPNAVGEGQYQVSKISADLSGGWVPMKDHIYENIANEKHGYLVAVNATEMPGLFYTRQLNNLGACRKIELAFTGWFASPLSWKGNEKANLKFILTDPVHNNILAEFTTGNMIDDENKWRQFGFRFTVPEGVNSLVLEIVNNNFGTAGGNDVLMDDIEIYLVMPAVRLVPAEHSLVCENNRTVLLKGEYTDDGTLGKFLDYRWEYSVNGTDNWVALTGNNATGSVATGIVSIAQSEYTIDNFDTSNDGYYRLVVGQSGAFTGPINYDCMAISEPRRLTLADEDQAPVLSPSLNGKTAYCYDDADSDGNVWITNTEKNTAENLKYSKYFWSLDGNIIEASDTGYDGTIVAGIKVKLTDLVPGYHTISLTASNIADCSETSIHEFLIYPQTTTWTAGGDVNNWNDSKNWSDGVPGKCTDVIIPNESMNFENGTALLAHYPLLLKPTTETLNGPYYDTNQENLNKQRDGLNDAAVFSLRPACDSITFKMGGAVARTDYLDYNFASVDLDIEPKRWYTVSAPLRSMYSGDYFIEGSTKRRNPTVYMMKYNTSNPQTNDTPIKQTGDFSNPFNTLTEGLYPGLGYAVWVDNENKPSDASQPFRFPKDSVKYDMWELSGAYVNTVAIPDLTGGKRSNLGRFSYEELITMNGTLPDGYPTGFEVAVKGDSDAYTTTMVGNPFMSHLDFGKFATTNSITGGYYIWEGNSYSAFNPTIFSDDPNEIPPMQAFVINKNGKIEKLTFTMDMAIKAPDPSSKGAIVRSAIPSQRASVLRMDVLCDGVIHSNIRLKYDQSEKNNYNARKDMWTLFAENIKTPVILYALLDGKAATIRTLGDLSEPIELGIHTVRQGTMTLRLSGMETLNDFYDLYLEDRLLGVVQNMRENPEYTFENQTGDIKGRFVLRTTQEPTGNELISTNPGISIYSINKSVKIESPANDPIQTVKIYSVLGELLHETNAIGTHIYNVDIASGSQIVIVTVTTKLTKKNDKVLIK